MAIFDLGRDLSVTRAVPAGLERTWALSRDVVARYEGMGYRVAFKEEARPTSILAEIGDAQGTRITTRVTVAEGEAGSALTIALTGKVAVGGMAGMFATDQKVRAVARERLDDLLDKVLGDLEPEPVAPAPAKVAAPSIELAKPAPRPAEPPKAHAPSLEPARQAAPHEPPKVHAPSIELAKPAAPRPAEPAKPAGPPAKPPESAKAAASGTGVSTVDRLILLTEMLDRGLIDEADFRAKKREILGG